MGIRAPRRCQNSQTSSQTSSTGPAQEGFAPGAWVLPLWKWKGLLEPAPTHSARAPASTTSPRGRWLRHPR